MAILEVEGLRIGEGRPKTIVSVMDTDAQGLAHTCERALYAGADLLEWRSDFWPDVYRPEAVAGTCLSLSETCAGAAPLIFTCRTKAQGGNAEMTSEAYQALLRSVISQSEPSFVDIELWIGDEAVRALVDLAHEQGVHVIISHHDFTGTPSIEQMEALLWHEAQLGADVAKLAVFAQSEQDAQALMEATQRVSEQASIPLCTMAMGAEGSKTRLLGETFGSALTFCALGRASAPGQVELAGALAALEELHASLARP